MKTKVKVRNKKAIIKKGKSLPGKTTITALKFDEKNFNTGTPYGDSLLAKSIEKFGFREAGTLDKNGILIGGNKRTAKAGELGFEDVEIIQADPKKIYALQYSDIDINTPEGRELAIALNQTASKNILMDAELIIAEVSEAVAIEWGIDLPENEVAEDDFEIPETIRTDIKLGDIFEIGSHRLLCGNSTSSEDVAKLMNGEKADMVFTDPPYAVNYEKKSEEILGNGRGKGNSKIKSDDLSLKEVSETIWKPAFKNLYESAKDDCSFYMTMCQGGDQMMMMMMMENAGWQIKHELIWVKSSPVFSMGRLDYDYQHEPIIYGWKKKHHFYGKGDFKKSVWEIPKPAKSEDHPTMKPIALMGNAIKNSSKEGNLIIDFFYGSGSTIVAAHQLERKCYAIELDRKYCQVIIDRMLKLEPSIKIKRNGKNWKA